MDANIDASEGGVSVVSHGREGGIPLPAGPRTLLWRVAADAAFSFFARRRLYGPDRTLEDELGPDWGQRIPAPDLRLGAHIFVEAFALRRCFTLQYRLRDAGGGLRLLREQGAPYFAPDGSFLGFFGCCEDITAPQIAGERTAALENTVDDLEAFNFAVVHELRAPLRVIDGCVQFLQETRTSANDEDGAQAPQRIQDCVARIGARLDSLLNLARAGSAGLVRDRVDLSALAREVLRELRQDNPHRAVESDVQDQLLAHADPHLLRVVLENLLGNAWKFTAHRETAHIAFGAECAEADEAAGTARAISYFVRDNGAGFDPDHAARLFVPFQRLHTAEDFPGTGLGLATTRRIIHRHGGRIWARGKPEEGAAFCFTLG